MNLGFSDKVDEYCALLDSYATSTGVLISPCPDLLPDVFCLVVRIFRFMLVLLYIYIYINSTNIPPIVIINRIYEHKILPLSL